MATSVQCRQTLTPLEPEKGTCQGTTKWKDAMSLNPATGQEAAGGSEPSLLGQLWSSHQAAVWPAIIDKAESAEEVEGDGVQGKILWAGRKVANQATQSQS